MDTHNNLFNEIICLKNLFASWSEFKSGKRFRNDVQEFERKIEDKIFTLHEELSKNKYRHSHYTAFYITDPKIRHIHKANIRDRIVHHAIFRILYPIFDHGFIFDSFSCRFEKGTHKAIERLGMFIRKLSHNHTKACFVLKCDIKKFFDSVDHQILLGLIRRKITDPGTIWLLKEIINSFVKTESHQLNLFADIDLRKQTERDMAFGRGIPIGNLTSQLFANIYMNEFDQFVKHKLKIKSYVRYTDDFVIVSDDRNYLENLLPVVQSFLKEKLKLQLHPNKVYIRKINRGIDFLGYVILPHYRRLRTKTKRRIFTKLRRRVTEYKAGLIGEESLKQSLNSFLGVLSHADAHNCEQKLLNQYWFWLNE